MPVRLGASYKDSITGFEGIAVALTEWLHACRRIGIQSKDFDKEGKPIEIQWFDEPQLVSLRTKKPVTNTTTKTGGPPAGGVETG